MKYLPQLGLLLSALSLVGCGGGDAPMAVPPATPPPAPIAEVTPAPVNTAPPVAAPPTGIAPAAMEQQQAPDVFTNYKVSKDGSPNKTDVEAMQAVVDGYAFGKDGLGAPPLNSLDELVTKGYMKRLPTPPAGMKWAYDSAKWKVSQVPQ